MTVIQGEPAQFHVEVPAGYEVTGVTGATLDSTETKSGVLTLKVNAPAQRSQQFFKMLDHAPHIRARAFRVFHQHAPHIRAFDKLGP